MLRCFGCLVILGAGAMATLFWIVRAMVDREDYGPEPLQYEAPAFV